MKSVIDNEHTIVIKNSRFICFLFQVERKEDILERIGKIKSKYYDATHCCYAYILDGEKKESDDGEPSGTAGIPMLQVLEKNELNHVLCIVVRYFGKIKLGASGLVRAYTKSVTEALKEHIVFLKEGVCANIVFPYSVLKNVDYVLKDVAIVSKNFEDKITYQIHATLESIEKLRVIPDVVIEIGHSLYL